MAMPSTTPDPRDAEFISGPAAQEVHEAVSAIAARVERLVGPGRLHIRDVVRGRDGAVHQVAFTERELRVVRFAMQRAGDSI
jgi:hypothetical protein